MEKGEQTETEITHREQRNIGQKEERRQRIGKGESREGQRKIEI